MVDVADSKSAGGDTVWVRAPPPVPLWSANFDDTAPNAVSSRLSGLKRLEIFLFFPLMTITRLVGLEPLFRSISGSATFAVCGMSKMRK